MRAARQLHLRGALGAVRTETWEGREHLVVPMVALMEGVIHAVNAKTAEFVPAAALAASVNKWKGHPIVIGHPVRDGHQISAHDPEVLAKHGCGFIRQAEMKGTKLGMEALIDPARLEKLGRHQLLADLRAGKGCEVSVGAFVTTNDKRSAFNGKSYEGEWLEIGPDHTALLPDGIGACSIAMGCGTHRAAEGAYLVTAAGFEALSNPEGINQYTNQSGSWKEGQLASHADDPEHKVRIVGQVEGAGKVGQLHSVTGHFAGVRNAKGKHLGYFHESNLKVLGALEALSNPEGINQYSKGGGGSEEKPYHVVEEYSSFGKRSSHSTQQEAEQEAAKLASKTGMVHSVLDTKGEYLSMHQADGKVSRPDSAYRDVNVSNLRPGHVLENGHKVFAVTQTGGKGTPVTVVSNPPDKRGTKNLTYTEHPSGTMVKAKLKGLEGFEALSNPEGINQWSKGQTALIHNPKRPSTHNREVVIHQVTGHESSPDYHVRAVDGKELYPSIYKGSQLKTKLSLDATGKRQRGKSFRNNEGEGDQMTKIERIKARILALFDTPEQAASEEAAELVAYNSMRVLFDGVGDQWDEASGLIDDLISDETDDPTQTPAEEQAEEEVEAARLDSIRTICYTMITTLQNVINAANVCQVPDLPEPSDPRYAEALRTAVGARNSAADMEHIQGMHDSAMALGAKCDRANAMRSLANPEGINQYTVHGESATGNMSERSSHGSAKEAHAAAKSAVSYTGTPHEVHDKSGKVLARYSATFSNRWEDAPPAGKGQYGVQRDLAAGSKDCPECDGTGQVTKDDKQSDCASCDGTGVLKTAELKAACRCEEADVNKTERIAALLKNEHNPIKDVKVLEASSDEVLTALEAQVKTAADLKAAEAKIAELKAAAEKQLTEEEYLKTAPESIRTLVADKKAQDAAHKTALIATLKVAAKGVYTDEELDSKSILELTKLTQLAKVETPATDYSGRAIPTPRAAAGEDYTPPNPYEAGLKVLKAAAEQVN